jgi:membrane-associated protein
VILARFVPIVRTFCPPVAGAAKMPYSRYLLFDFLGGVFWIGTMILSGYSLAHLIPNIGQRIHYVILVVIFLSLLPPIISVLRKQRTAQIPSASPVTTPEKP